MNITRPFHSSYPHHHGSQALIRSGSGGGWKGCTVGPDKGSPVTRCRSNRFYAHSHAGETRPYRATGLAASPASDSWFVTGGSRGLEQAVWEGYLSLRYAWVAETGSKSRRQELWALAQVCAQNWRDVWLIIHDVRRRVTVLPMMTLRWRWQHFSPRPCNHPCCAQSGAL